jgi:hypothetical protein
MGQATSLMPRYSVNQTKPSGRSAGGEECKEFESSAQLCDSPNGSTFAWVMQDRVACM